VRVSELHLTPVSVPFDRDELWSYGRRSGISNVLVQVVTDEGVTGVGEAVGWPSPEVALAVLEDARPVVLGRDPFRIGDVMRVLYDRRGWHYFRHTAGCALGGLEMALWDAVAKACGLPLHSLFGGAIRERVTYYWHVPAGDAPSMVAAARSGVESGYNTLYVKVGFEQGGTVREVRAVRDAVGPGPRIRVDANEAWTVAEARAAVREMEGLGLEFVEQPVNMYDHDALAEVSDGSSVPIAANQTTWDEYATLYVLKRGIAAVVVTDPHQAGGLARFKQLCAIAEIAGVPVVKHSFGDLGISTYACAHVLSSCANCGLAHQTHCQLLHDDVIVGGVPRHKGGALELPEAPGIGVELDPDRVDRYSRLYAGGTVFSAYEAPKEQPV
jgi:L-alanine-DL-glutamate epimerase-like enolase superfamily enzyme